MQRPTFTSIRALLLVLAAAGLGGPAAAQDAPPGSGPKAPAPPAKPSDTVPVEQWFHGKITKLDAGWIEVHYDFADASQLRDFEASLPFRAIRTVQFELKSGHVAFSGTGSMRLKAAFDGEVTAAATFTPRRPRDFGFAVTEERESEVFTLYCCYDRYFGAGDNVHVPQNMVIKFIPRDPKVNKDGLQDWRYCGSRGQKPEIVAGRPCKVSIQRRGIESGMAIDDWETRPVKEAGRDLTAMMVAVYGYDSQVDFDDLVIAGKLDAGWVARNRIDLTTWKPPVEPGPKADPGAAATVPDAVVERVRAQIAGYPLDTKHPALAALLRDTSIPVSLRAEAAEKAKEVGSKKIVPFLVDGLYSDDLDARRLSAEVLKAVTGKSFSFRADASEESRKKAIQDLNEYLRKHPEEFV